MNILIVEHDVVVGAVLTKRIEEWGYRVENTDTGRGALERLRKKKFDLILLDIFLSDVQGHQLISQFKQLCPKVQVVTMTDNNSRELEMIVREQGILYYMIKPVEATHLRSLLDHFAQKRRNFGSCMLSTFYL